MAICVCTCCCFGLCLSIVFLGPIWAWGSQCGDGWKLSYPGLSVSVTSVIMKTGPQDKDGEDDVEIVLRTGMCRGTSNLFRLRKNGTAKARLSKDSDGRPLDLGHVNTFFNYPLTVFVEEQDTMSDDVSSFRIQKEQLAKIRDVLDADGVEAVNYVGFVALSENNPVERLKDLKNLLSKFGVDDVLCVSAVDLALGKLSKGGKAARTVGKTLTQVKNLQNLQSRADQLNKSGLSMLASGASAAANNPITQSLVALDEATTFCPVDVLADAFGTKKNGWTGEALYEVRLKVTKGENGSTTAVIALIWIIIEFLVCCCCCLAAATSCADSQC